MFADWGYDIICYDILSPSVIEEKTFIICSLKISKSSLEQKYGLVLE